MDGKFLKSRRLELNLTLEDVAKVVGVGKSTVRKWETGDIENMRRDKIALLAKALDISPLTIMGVRDFKDEIVAEPKTPYIVASQEVPLYGSIAAGLPLEMIEIQEFVEIPLQIANKYPEAFLLTVKGDSMNKVVLDGAYALIDPVEEVNNGDVVAVNINGFEATLKRFYKLNNTIVLEPDSYNSDHNPQAFDCTKDECSEIKVIGRLVWFMASPNNKF